MVAASEEDNDIYACSTNSDEGERSDEQHFQTSCSKLEDCFTSNFSVSFLLKL